MKKVYLLIFLCCLSFCGFAQAYCTPSFGGASTACSVGINFTKFQITGVSGTSINDLGVCNGTTNYTNNAGSMSVSLSRGSTYSVSLLSSGSFAIDVQVWIDFNDDFNFDGSETVGGMTNYVSPATINLIIPGGANLGAHRMRIIGNYTGCCGGLFYPSINSCGTAITYGEARDYTVNIGVSNDAPVFSNGATQSMLVCLSAAPVSLASILQASDGDVGQTVTWSTTIAPAHGTLIATYTTTSTGGGLTPSGLTFTPTPGYSGTDVFAVTVSDGLASSTTTVAVNINVIAAITGTTTFPVGYNTTLFNPTAGGSWSSGNTAVATAGSTGVISGVSIGTATISYSKSTACGVLHSTRDVSVVAYATSPIITTFAGINAYGYSGNGGPATSAMLNTAHGLAIDAAGNVYIADYSNHAIRKVNTAGIISTIAGTNVSGYTGDGGPASAAMLNRPTKLCFDAAGNLYFTDQQCVIRKISTTGIITTVAGNGIMASSGDGGPASAASFHDPYGICIDAGGNIYVGEYQGYRVRKISAGGMVSTFTGNGTTNNTGDGGPASAAAVGRPIGLCIDGGGNILIADSYNNVIRKVNTSGIISTVAGNGGWGYTGDGGPATAATLNLPWDVTVDALGNIIIGDLYNHMVRKVNASGIISTLAGTGTAGITGDNGPATAAKLNHPYAVVTDGAGNIYIGTNTTVRKIGSTSATSPTNRAPAFVNGTIQSATACSGTALAISSLLPVHDSDASQTETWTVNVAPLNGSLSGFSATATSTGGAVSPTGTFYTSTAGFSGLDTFTIKVSDGTDTAFTTIVVTVNPATPITGASGICQGNTMSLSNATPGGAWSSSNTSVATVGTTGVVSGIGTGTAIISYALPSGCIATAVVTIYATPAAITGTLYVCQGTTSALSSDLSGGFWMSGNTSVATINSSTGLASGMSPGTASITYTMGTGCQTFSVMTVIASPAAISGTTTVCAGANTTLSSTPGGVFWSSSNTAIATIGSASGVVTGVAGGTVLISYTNLEGCTVFRTVTVNPAAVAGTISGASSVCTGASIGLTNPVTGGTWSSSNNLVATVNSFASVSGIAAGTVIISYSKSNSCGTTVATKAMTVNPTPVAGTITGTATLCTGSSTTLSNPTGTVGGIWTSAATGIATVGSLSGIVSGVSAGTATISYSITNTCGSVAATRIVTVSILTAGAITGEDTIYVAVSTTLVGTITGGTWSSSNTSIATIGSSSGDVTGILAGSVVVTYTISNSCGTVFTTMPVYVLPTDSFRLIHRYAGTAGVYGNTGDGGAALSATIGYPKDVAVDAAGNIYIADGEWQVIRKVNTSGVITRYAGNATYDFSGDGGPATAASFNYIQGVGTDGLGNVYVADANNNRIRKISPSGVITTCAGNGLYGYTGDGGAATAARIGAPNGVCGDASGNIYIADAGNHAVRKVSTSGIITTIAGTGVSGYTGDGGPATAAKLHAPQKVAIDAAGNIYVSLFNNVIRKINTSGTISTIAGTSVSGYSGDGGPATIAKITPSNGVAVDGSGNVYLSDYTNNVVRMINTSGVISTIAGTGVNGYSGDGGPAIFAKMNTAMGLAVNTAGEVFIADAGNRIIRVLGAAPGSDNDAPVFVNGATQSFTICQGSAAVSLDTMLLVNDTDMSQTLTWSIATAPGQGMLSGFPVSAATSSATVTPSGLSYTPDSGYSGSDVFVIAVSDGIATTTTTINVTITPSASAGTLSSSGSLCAAATNTLTSTVTGGIWTSGNTTVATIGSSSGIAYGVAGGTATISYTVAGFCGSAIQTILLTVDALPALTLTYGTTVNICPGESLLLSTDSLSGFDTGAATYSTSFLNSPEASGPTSVCDCPPGYVVVGYSGQTGAWLDKFNLLCRQFSDGVLTGATVATAFNGASTATPSGPYIFGGSTIMVGVQMHVSAPYFTSMGFLAGIKGYGQSASYIHSTGVNATSPASLTTMIGYYSNSPLGTLFVPDGNVITGMNSYNNYYATGISLRYRPISSFYTTGASWTSSNPAVATVSGVGVVSGISIGTAIITYSATNSCGTTDSLIYVTVGTGVDAGVISGDSIVITGDSTMLTSSVGGGTWSVSNANASITTTGMLTGVSAGTVVVSYSVSSACGTDVAIYGVTVMSDIDPITGPSVFCQGSDVTLSSATAGGTWSSGNTAVATVISTSGLVTGVSAGTAVISYTTAGGFVTLIVSVLPLPVITGTASVCIGGSETLSSSLSGGIWSSGNTTVATVGSSTGVVLGISSGTVSINYTSFEGCTAAFFFTVNTMPSSVSGSVPICEGASIVLESTPSGGAWTTGDMSIATVDVATGVLTGISAGTTSVTYVTTSGCTTSTIVTVNASPGTISGTLSVCIGSSTSLSSSPSGGTWTSGNTSRATVDAASGVVTGVSTGNVDVTYTLAGGCRRKVTVTVAATPAPITGALSLCAGSTSALSSATTGGSWSSTATGIATVDAGTGIVTGISTGAATISYSNGSCAATVIVTVNASAGANTGTASVCIGSSSSLSNATTGGTWSSSDAGIATVHASTGLVTGVGTGVVNITYTATPGCYAITSFTVNATVASITGTLTVCPGETTTLSSATSGGSWSSSNTTRATIEAGAGIVTGVSGGTVTISYIVSAGCSQTAIVTVYTSPAGISGTATVCEGATTTLTCSPGGGTWSSSSAAATVGSTGIVTGVSAGTATITYTAGTGCAATREVTVNVTPAAITGSLGVCVGNTSSLSSTPSGGTWAVAFTTKATVGSTSGIVTGVAVGTTPVTYTAGGCRTTATVSVVTTPAAIGGTLTLCAGSTTNLISATTGGTWTSSNTGVATVVSGTGVVTGVSSGTVVISYSNGSCETTRVVTVNAALSTNSGSSTVCVGQGTDLNNATSGGTWSSSNTAIATVNATTGLVVGVSAGAVNISYRVGAGCFSITEMTVNATLSSIAGTASVCPGATTALSHAVAGGVWTSGIPARATIDAGTGVVTGVSAGTVYITYAVGGCFTTRIVTVSAAPGAIGGTASVCEGGTITLTCSPTGGTWSSVVPTTATVSGTGVVTGISAGTTTISYTRLGCAATRVVTVTSAPAAIGGTLSACIGTSTTLSSSPAGGTWSSSNPARFTVVAGTGVVTGVSAGTATVTYAMSATCRATAVVTINASAGAISGSLTVCETCTTTLSSATSGGTWSSSNTAAATIGAGTGVVSGVGIGTTTISYVAGGCSGSAVVTVIAAIPSSFGTPVVCVGQTNATMGNPVAGGTWSSSNTSLATIHATTGLLTGIAVGNPNITYTTSPGVYTITVATVSAAVANITGTAAICPGATVALSNATAGGTWSSTNTARATVDAGTGVVTGVAAGTVTISYTINVGCYKAITQTVNAAPNVTGANNVVNGASTTFGGSPGGGTWSSANPAIASVSGTGVVTGNSVAATTITYTLPATGCFGTRSINVVAARAGSPSGAVESAGVLKVFPNPTSGTLTIDAPINGTFTVYTIDGKEVVAYKVGESALTVSLPQQLAAGVYMCRFNGADGTSEIVRLVYER